MSAHWFSPLCEITLDLHCIFRTCNDNSQGCSEFWSGLTKEHSGLHKFTDSTNFDYEPADMYISAFDTELCYTLKPHLVDRLCSQNRSFICVVPGLLTHDTSTLKWLSLWPLMNFSLPENFHFHNLLFFQMNPALQVLFGSKETAQVLHQIYS